MPITKGKKYLFFVFLTNINIILKILEIMNRIESFGMTQEEKVKYWVDLAEEDLAVGETLVKNEHNLYAVFMCHQVVEKVLKGYFRRHSAVQARF
jgi:metal-dependent HD superfamily phosphatase/phosphodiesterase